MALYHHCVEAGHYYHSDIPYIGEVPFVTICHK